MRPGPVSHSPLLLAAALTVGLLAPPAQADGQVLINPPHRHGWWLGDVLPMRATVLLEDGFRLDPSSLPQAGPLDYWLELRGVTATEGSARDGRTAHRLAFEYQTFYAPLEPKAMTVPRQEIGFLRGQERVTVAIPSWSFVTSPLREIQAPSRPESMRPDAPVPVISVRPQEWRAAIAGGLAVLALLALAWHRAWGPFARPDRPFAAAAAAVHRLARRGDDPDAQRAAFLALHRAFDRAFGRRLLAGNLADFLTERPGFRALSTEIVAFFEASRVFFFRTGPDRVRTAAPPDSLAQLARRLAAVERGRP